MFVLKLLRLAIVAVALVCIVAPAAPATATTTICVGLVVDARAVGGQVSAGCTKVPDGSTGYDVLRAAGHTVGFRHDGLICTIDNRPADGCAATDATHFWAYFHRKPHSSSWTYSDEGATTYEPKNGETEGWVWRDGNSATPEAVPYATVCPQATSPTPQPSPHATFAPAHRAGSVHADPVPTSAPIASSPARARQHQHHDPQTSPTTASTTVTATRAPRPTTAIAAVSSSNDNGSSGAPWTLIAAVAAVVVIGGAAGWRYRRRGSD